VRQNALSTASRFPADYADSNRGISLRKPRRRQQRQNKIRDYKQRFTHRVTKVNERDDPQSLVNVLNVLEDQPQAQLNLPRAAISNYGVARVRRCLGLAERIRRIEAARGLSVIGVIDNVEDLDPELGAESLL
jgi:hypothetical protein